MNYSAEIILDSVAPNGQRLTTMLLRYPRFIHPEFMTHRWKSRNASSSRAYPVSKYIDDVSMNPVIPVYWGATKKGMQAGDEIEHTELAEKIWLELRDQSVIAAKKMAGLVFVDKHTGEVVDADHPSAVQLKLHKQIVNRILEPWAWISVICSATGYSNFFNLRCHPDAQPEIQKLANMMKEVYDASEPTVLAAGEWHIPFIQEDEQHLDLDLKRKMSVARCARVSYLNHLGVRDIDKDLETYEKLLHGSDVGHWSPFEHVAQAAQELVHSGNFYGFYQFRQMFDGQNLIDEKRI